MSGRITETVYLVLEEAQRWGKRREDGTVPVYKFRVARMLKTKPQGVAGAVVVKLNVAIDPSIFDAVVPVVDLDLQAGDVIMPTIEVQAGGEADGS